MFRLESNFQSSFLSKSIAKQLKKRVGKKAEEHRGAVLLVLKKSVPFFLSGNVTNASGPEARTDAYGGKSICTRSQRTETATPREESAEREVVSEGKRKLNRKIEHKGSYAQVCMCSNPDRENTEAF